MLPPGRVRGGHPPAGFMFGAGVLKKLWKGCAFTLYGFHLVREQYFFSFFFFFPSFMT